MMRFELMMADLLGEGGHFEGGGLKGRQTL